MFDALFQALFSYRPVVFQQGEFRFDVSSASLVAALVAGSSAAVAIFTYRRVTVADGTPSRHASSSPALRLAALGLVLFCLFRPTLVVRAAVNQRNVVAVLLDDSRSMQIPDVAGQAARAVGPRRSSARPTARLLKPLSDRFLVRVFRFSSAARARRVGQGADVRRHPDQARQLARRRARGAARAAGGRRRAGVGRRRHQRDVAVGRAARPQGREAAGVHRRRRLRGAAARHPGGPRHHAAHACCKGASLMVDVVVDADRLRRPNRHGGRRGRRAHRRIGEGRSCRPTARPPSVRVRAEASEPGPRLFKFRVAPQDGEVGDAEQRARGARSTSATRASASSTYEGEPRFEMKFLRRAVADDKNLLTVALQRTADNKYMRLDGDPDEVAGGFPKTRDELFRYRGLILGSVEAGAFSRRPAADDRRLRRSPRRRPADAGRRRGRSARAATAARRWPTRCRC